MSTYKSEVFNLCKKISNSELSSNIIEMWNNLKNDDSLYINKTAWFTSTKDEQNHFYGVLLAQSEPDENLGIFANVPRLNESELILCKQGNEFLLNLSNALVNELDFLPISIRKALNPYAKLRSIQPEFYENISITSQEKIDVSELKKEFRKIYIFDLIKIKTREFNTDFFNAFQTKNVLEIFSIFERNEIECGYNDIPKNLWSIKKNKQNDTMTNEEMLEFFFFTLYVLRDIITITLNTLYSALIGKNLPVLSNNNLIAVKGPSTNHLFKKYELVKISSEGNYPRIGNLFLLDTQPIKDKGSLIHTFVYAVEIIEQMDGKFGSITSIEGLEVDESLNRFFNFFKK
ncbi:hypothetical protein [Streptococcus lutetiensis]|uniref:hypothetical protein n=1 Tax=Streptococcus lutetiensis TaxID=150055 RepID=UPI003569C6D4